MNYGALQGTCHLDSYETRGPARQIHKNRLFVSDYVRWIMMVVLYHFVCFHSYVAEYDNDQDFIPRLIYFLHRHVQTNQPTNWLTN